MLNYQRVTSSFIEHGNENPSVRYDCPMAPTAFFNSRSCKRRRMWPSTMTTRRVWRGWPPDIYVDTHYVYVSGWWFGTWLSFFHRWGKIIPTDFHIFQRGRYTTNQVCIGISVSIGEQETQKGVHGLDGPAAPLFCLLFGRCFSISNPAVHFLKCLQVPSQKRIE